MQPAAPITDSDAHYDQVLRDIVDMAADIARMIHTQVATQVATPRQPAPTHINNQFPDPTLAFDRIAGTIRRTILLARKLPHLRTAPAGQDATLRRIASRKRIIRQVEDVIQRASPERADCLEAEFRERLDSPDLEDDIDHRPLPDIVADICRDLRVAIPYFTNYKRRTPAEVAALCAQAAALPDFWREERPRLPPRHHTGVQPSRRRSSKSRGDPVGYEEARNREGIG